MRRATLVAIAGLMVLASCSFEDGPRDLTALPGGNVTTPRQQAAKRPSGGPALAIGDSLLVGAIEHGNLANKLFEDSWTLETVAEEGRTARWAVDRVRELAAVPRYVVVVLGSNPGHSSAGFTDDVQSLRDALVARGARRIIWVPPHHANSDRYAEKIRILGEADAKDARLVVPDWAKILDESEGYVGSDGLHLTDAGYDALATFIQQMLTRYS